MKIPVVMIALGACLGTALAQPRPNRGLRELLRLSAPGALEVVERLEAQRGRRFEDRELEAVIGSPAWQEEFKKWREAWCAQPQHHAVLLCKKEKA